MEKTNFELIEALQGIQDELKRINQTLAKLTSGKSAAAESSAPVGRTSAAPGRSYSAAPRGGKPAYGSKAPYSRPSRPAQDFEGAEGGESLGSRFPKRKPAGSTRSAAGPGRPKGKAPAKKGNGYPKKGR